MSTLNGKVNYCVFIGDDFSSTLTLKQAGSIIDVTGYSFKMQIRKCKDSTTVLHELNSPAANGIDITNAANGIIILTIPSASTAALKQQNAVYDLFWTDTAGKKKTISQGNFQILSPVTAH